MEESIPTTYVLKRESDRWVFVPSAAFVNLMVGAFGAGSLFLIYLSTLFFRRGFSGVPNTSATVWFGVAFLAVAGFSASLAIRAWRTRRTPLSVDLGGRVSYGKRELCAAGTVQAVRITPPGGREAIECEVCLEVAGGKLVSMPSQYFAGFNRRAHARPFAADLAKALGVRVRPFSEII
ncbi:MAG TPA: hypothetical protein VN841_13515 [Bryobacteraceae bacterium]|nr:hypothetical protein [Bryobacteraceae bacterium]